MRKKIKQQYEECIRQDGKFLGTLSFIVIAIIMIVSTPAAGLAYLLMIAASIGGIYTCFKDLGIVGGLIATAIIALLWYYFITGDDR